MNQNKIKSRKISDFFNKEVFLLTNEFKDKNANSIKKNYSNNISSQKTINNNDNVDPVKNINNIDGYSRSLKKLGKISDVYIDSCNNKITAFSVKTNSIFPTVKFLSIDDIDSQTKDKIIIKKEAALKSIDFVKKTFYPESSVKSFKKDYKGTKVLNPNLRKIGFISDAILNYEYGSLEEFELSSDVLDDIQKGKKKIKFSNNGMLFHNKKLILNSNNRLQNFTKKQKDK